MDKVIRKDSPGPSPTTPPADAPATADESQRQHVIEVLKAVAMREAAERTATAEEGGDPYNTATRKLPKNVPWAHLVRKD